MSRSVLPAVAILATATALVLAAAAVVIRPPQTIPTGGTAPAANAGSASRAVVERFYAAVNLGIATGHVDSLNAILAPDYAEGDAFGETAPGRERLAEAVRELHETNPSLRLTADPIIADDTRAVATVQTSGIETAHFLGLPVVAALLWGPTDVFRISDSLVIERLSAVGDRATLESLVQVPVSFEPTAGRRVTAMRFVLPPGGERAGVRLGGLRLLYVEAGELSLAIADTFNAQGQGGKRATPAGAGIASAGEAIVRPDGAAYTARNNSDAPATYLEISAVPVPPQSATSYDVPQLDNLGARPQSQVVSPDSGIETAVDSAVISIGRATLEPGGRFVWEGAQGPTMLLSPDGTAGLSVNGEHARTRQSSDSNREHDDQSLLADGDGALLLQGTGATLSNPGDEPVAILVVTLLGGTHGDARSAPEPLSTVAVVDIPERGAA